MSRYREPFDEILGFSRSMDRMLSSVLLQENGTAPSMWRPPTDVYETSDQVVIMMEIAGMDPDKIQVDFSDHILTVSGTRQDRHQRETCHCLEIQYGDFSSKISLPGNYDREAIAAEYANGFLTVTLPKLKPQRQKIAVQSEDLSGQAPAMVSGAVQTR